MINFDCHCQFQYQFQYQFQFGKQKISLRYDQF